MAMKIVIQENAVLPMGNSSVGFVLSVPAPIGTGGVIALLEVLDRSGNRIAAQTVRRCDVAKAGVAQRFAIVVKATARRNVILRMKAVNAVTAHWVNIRNSVSPAWPFSPLWGNPRQPGQWWADRAPVTMMPTWIDPRFANYTDTLSVPIHYRIREALWCIGRVCGLGFHPVPFNNSKLAFHQAPAEEIERLSIQFGNSLEWFGTNRYGSIYMAKHPNNMDAWIGHRLKDAQGGGKLSPTNIIRFVLNVFQQMTMGFGYHVDGVGICAARNANFSGPIKFSRHDSECLAGTDKYERGIWQKTFGKPWIVRWDD